MKPLLVVKKTLLLMISNSIIEDLTNLSSRLNVNTTNTSAWKHTLASKITTVPQFITHGMLTTNVLTSVMQPLWLQTSQ